MISFNKCTFILNSLTQLMSPSWNHRKAEVPIHTKNNPVIYDGLLC